VGETVVELSALFTACPPFVEVNAIIGKESLRYLITISHFYEFNNSVPVLHIIVCPSSRSGIPDQRIAYYAYASTGHASDGEICRPLVSAS